MHRIRINCRIVGRAIAAIVVLAVAMLTFASQKTELSIPLSDIVTTSPQPKMRYLADIFPDDTRNNYERQFSGITTNASNIFLVDAANNAGAIGVSAAVLFGALSADTAAVANMPKPQQGSHWMVAYLGFGPSEPTWWTIEGASVEGDKIRLTYRKAKTTEATADIHHYYYWIPLGKLKPGVYYVELFDSSVKAITLSRRVVVMPERHP